MVEANFTLTNIAEYMKKKKKKQQGQVKKKTQTTK